MSGTGTTLQRLERLLTLVPWLLENPGADIAVVSRELGVPRDDLLHDLDLLGYCGLPGYGGGDLIEVSVVGDHVTLRMADYFRRPLRLSMREAVTLLLAGRAVAGVPGLVDAGPLRSAVARLEHALGVTGEGAPRLAIDLGGPGDEHLPELRDALTRRRVVRLTYRSESKAETSEREVEPWALTAAAGAWYLQGWCRVAQGPRDFRLDRVRALAVTDEPAPVPEAPPPPPVYRPEPGDPEVVLDLEPRAHWLAGWVVPDEVTVRGRVRRVSFRVDHLDWAARLVLRLEGAATVVGPPELRARAAELARAALERYNGPEAALP